MPTPVRITKAYGWYKKGQIINPVGMNRSFLISFGYAEEIKDEPAPEPVEIAAPVEEVAATEPEPDEPAPEPEHETPRVAVAPEFQNTSRRGRRGNR
jgi:hypothetical protein